MIDELDPDSRAILDRIQARLEAVGKSERGAAEEAGLSAAAIRHIRDGKSKSPRIETMRKLAPVLETTPEWLAFGRDDLGKFGGGDEVAERAGGVQPPPGAAPFDGVTQVAAKFVRAAYGGVVEAGAFRAVDDFGDEEQPPITVEQDTDFPDAPFIVFDVAGDSMNDLRPHPIHPGGRVVAVDFEALRSRVAPRDGMVVIVEQTLDGGRHRERSVKQIELYQDRIEFHPRSTNKRHKPIVVPNEIHRDPSEEDGREVRLLAIVRRISNEVPLS